MGYMAEFGLAFGTVFGWVLIGLVATVPVQNLVRLWSENVLSVLEAMGLIGLILIMFGLLIAPTPPAVKTLVFLVLLATSISIPLLSKTLSKKDRRDFHDEREQVFRASLEKNPQNVAARIELAKNLHTQGRVSEAMEELEYSIQLSPRTTQNEAFLLKNWAREFERQENPITICPFCREDTHKDRPECRHCGRSLSGLVEAKSVMLEDLPGSIRKLLILIPALLIASFLLSMLSGLGAALLMLILITGGMFWVRKRL